ncbi:MAG: LysR family transcriptional regulator [Paracoccaceae bacterium]|nr:MAG: LysR family transcriptional regulator [Paracoccaceae bacterium]
MDLALLKTFLQVAETGSFIAASERLFVTQSAVSLRIQRLEDQLGQQLFLRAKTGAELTPNGREFEGYARSLIRTWEEARARVAVPDGFARVLTIGAQVTLWPRIGFRWIDALREAVPDLGIRADMGTTEELTLGMTEGAMQVMLTHTPRVRPGLSVERLIEDELVLVASWEGATVEDLNGRYAQVDWGAEFMAFQGQNLPGLRATGLTLGVGALATRFAVGRGMAAFLPAAHVKRHVDAGRLHLVEDVPRFPYPVWSVWRDDLDEDLAEIAEKTLRHVAERTESDIAELLDSL